MHICNIKELSYFLKYFTNGNLLIHTDDHGIDIKDKNGTIIGTIDQRGMEVDFELLKKVNSNGGTKCPLKQGG